MKEGGQRGFKLKIVWIVAHLGAEGNNMMDKTAKEAAKGMTDPSNRLQNYLAKLGNSLLADLSRLKNSFSDVAP